MLFASTGLTGRGAAILSTPSYHAAVRPDGHAFKSNRWEECVQMPAKMARSAPRPPFGLPKLTVAVRTSLLSCRKPENHEYSSQFGSHPGNPGKLPCKVVPTSGRHLARLALMSIRNLDKMFR